MNIETGYFIIGFISSLTASFVGLYVRDKIRHRCRTDGCGCFKTTTYYRMFHLHHIPTKKNGDMMFAVYKFRECGNGHVMPSMFQKIFTLEQIRLKPEEELVWNDKKTISLLKGANLANPYEDYKVRQHNSAEPVARIIPASSVQQQKHGDHRTFFGGHHRSSS